jgi:hypothetical protein
MSNYFDENEPDTDFENMEEEESPAEDYSERNVLRESMIKLLLSPAPKSVAQLQYEDDLEPPREIQPEEIAAIPRIGTKAAADDLIDELDKNIELEEARVKAVLRAQKLEFLKSAERAKRCEHIKSDGETCGSAAMRSHRYCYHHVQAHASDLELPIIEDHRSLQIAYSRLAQQIVTSRIDANQAKLLIQILHSAAAIVPASSTAS